MKNEDKSREQIVKELDEAHQHIDELEKSEIQQRYRIIVDTADEGIWVFDEEYLSTFVNNRMVNLLGYEYDEIMGRSLSFFLFEEDLPDFQEKASRRRQGVAERYERRIRRKDSTILWAHVSATPIMDKEGLFRGSFAMFTDITERKEAEKALLESEKKYRSIFENAVEGMFQSTPDGQLITANPAMARIFGYATPEEMINQVHNIGLQLYSNEKDRRTFQQLLKEHGIAGGFEAPFYRQDGTVLWGTLNVRAVKDSDDNVFYYEGTLEDITPRKEAEEELKKSEEKYRNIFENAVMGIYQVTPSGQYLSANPVLSRIHGYNSPEEMIESVADITQLYVDPSRRAELKRIINEQGFVKGFEIIMRRRDGSLHWVSNTSRAVRDEHGTILYYEGTIEDITSRKSAEESVKQLKQTLLGTLHALSRSIEIREPGITGHHRRVSNLGSAIARAMGLADDMAESIRVAGLVHDIGNMSVPSEILSKPGRLTELEYNFVKLHPRSGYDILKETGLPYPVAEIVLQHHERMNGSGYPQGLKGKEMLLEARVLAVADVVEAMASPRPYRPAMGIDAALEEIRKNKSTLYDAQVVDTCLTLFKFKKFQLG
ncbi:MAG: domain S-box-containing protein/HDIG protein [Deltaproteobacteria bacterium]|nr:domain S-box-containing protein/HDIG protein [Deltaproteobacteria bacterium]